MFVQPRDMASRCYQRDFATARKGSSDFDARSSWKKSAAVTLSGLRPPDFSSSCLAKNLSLSWMMRFCLSPTLLQSSRNLSTGSSPPTISPICSRTLLLSDCTPRRLRPHSSYQSDHAHWERFDECGLVRCHILPALLPDHTSTTCNQMKTHACRSSVLQTST